MEPSTKRCHLYRVQGSCDIRRERLMNLEQKERLRKTPEDIKRNYYVRSGGKPRERGGRYGDRVNMYYNRRYANSERQQTTSPPLTSATPPAKSTKPSSLLNQLAMQYGQEMILQGKQVLGNGFFDNLLPPVISDLHYYFAVDNSYVWRKLSLLCFPFRRRVWAPKYDESHPIQPRHDLNVPDLYIPTMCFITYIFVASLLLGMQNRFTPEQFSLLATRALAYHILELIVHLLAVFIFNLNTSRIRRLDWIALSGYKYLNVVISLISSIFLNRVGYIIAFWYTGVALAYYLLCTMRPRILPDSSKCVRRKINGTIYQAFYELVQHKQDFYQQRKRKLYFLLYFIAVQWLITYQLTRYIYMPHQQQNQLQKSFNQFDQDLVLIPILVK